MSIQTRRVVLQPLKADRAEHAGLWLEKYLENQERKAYGEDDAKDTARHQLMHESTKIKVPEGYGEFFRRWESALAELSGVVVRRYARATGRVIVGLGAESASETAITLHHTFGVPFLPGSALKGLSAFYARNYLQDMGWRLNEQGKPGEAYCKLFGDTARAGCVTYYDAYSVPERTPGNKVLHTDTITVHHAEYYQGKNAAPADWDKPIPIPFVSASGIYLVALGGAEPEWVEAGLTILGMALEELGIGAKTSSGYGRMRLTESLQAAKAEPRWVAPAPSSQVAPSVTAQSPQPVISPLAPGRQRGTVMNVKGSYAFIQPDAGGRPVFVHESAMQPQNQPLRAGQRVEYTIGPGKKPGDTQAVDVMIVG
ncbi:MAG: type III-B CRISPR module RAMP protein Cmr6 [Caldilinea sp.]